MTTDFAKGTIVGAFLCALMVIISLAVTRFVFWVLP